MAAGEGENRLGDAAAGLLDAALGFGQVVGVEDDQRPAGVGTLALGEAAGEAAIVERAVIRSVFGEAPPESRAVEGAGALYIADIELDIVYAAVVFRGGHGGSFCRVSHQGVEDSPAGRSRRPTGPGGPCNRRAQRL